MRYDRAMGEDLVRVRVLAGGRVQGVAYRFYAEKCAARLGVTGWVRNLADGRVEVLAEGPAGSLARVETFEVRREPATGEFSAFRVVYHAD